MPRSDLYGEFSDDGDFLGFCDAAGVGVSTPPRPATICMVSDSTGSDGFNPAQAIQTQVFDSVAWWAAAYSKGAVIVGSTCSVGGWTTLDVDQHWKTRVADKKVGFVVIGVGLNDIYGATDATVNATDQKLRDWVKTRAREVLSWGGVPVIQTTFPCGSGYFASTATKRLAAFNHNRWRRAFARSAGLPLLDAEALMIDPASATAEPYAAYMQPAGSPHAGKELIRTLGQMLWDQTLSKLVPSVGLEQCNRYASNQLFSNPGFAGNGGNINGGNGASVLPDSVWGWQTGAHTTYSVQASTDSKLAFAGAPVKAGWVRVSTDVGQIAAAAGGASASANQPGVLFFSSGIDFALGDVVRAQAEIEVVTPNTIIGFDSTLQISGGLDTVSHVASSAFTPAANADNAKNQLLTPSVFTLPGLSLTLSEYRAGAGAWLTINPKFSGLNGANGAAVWRVRNVKVWRD